MLIFVFVRRHHNSEEVFDRVRDSLRSMARLEAKVDGKGEDEQ